MVAGTEPGQLGFMRDKLLNFLEDSNHYIPAKLLSRYDYAGILERKGMVRVYIDVCMCVLNINMIFS
jgi:hypothetical protein